MKSIIELAKQAGLKVGTNSSGVTLFGSPAEIGLAHIDIDEMERFAALVRAAAIEEAAGEIEDWDDDSLDPREGAAAIRELKEKP